MNSVQLIRKRELLHKQLDGLVLEINQLPKGNCMDCKHYRNAICQKYQQAPPVEFVEAGNCDEWLFDEYPVTLGELTKEEALRSLKK